MTAIQSRTTTAVTLIDKIKEEFTRYNLAVQFDFNVGVRYSVQMPLEEKTDVMEYWRSHKSEFPLLAMFFRAYSSFQPTSVASERVFTIDGLIMTKQRKCIDPERRESLLISQDYMRNRMNKETFNLCTKCPQPPNPGSCYKITCALHNK